MKKILADQGISVGIFDPRFIKPLDAEALRRFASSYSLIVTMEDHVLSGGFGSAVSEFYREQKISVDLFSVGLPDRPIKQGKKSEVMKQHRMDAVSIAERIVARREEKA